MNRTFFKLNLIFFKLNIKRCRSTLYKLMTYFLSSFMNTCPSYKITNMFWQTISRFAYLQCELFWRNILKDFIPTAEPDIFFKSFSNCLTSVSKASISTAFFYVQYIPSKEICCSLQWLTNKSSVFYKGYFVKYFYVSVPVTISTLRKRYAVAHFRVVHLKIVSFLYRIVSEFLY